MNIGAILTCWIACLSTIPWWVWIVLPLAGAALGAITYFFGLIGGPITIVVNALVKAIIIGALAAVLTPFLYCLLGCIGK